MIPAVRVLLSTRAGEALDALEASDSKDDRSIAQRVRAYKPILLVDCLHGEVVRKGAIPRALASRYGLENLYVEDLPQSWRMQYTVVKREGQRLVVVIEIVDRKLYSKWFPGRQRR
jgi:hypothetical protein